MKKKEYSGSKGPFKFILNVISWTSFLILILLALFLLYYTISNRLYQQKGEKFEPFVSLYTIVSGSMEPNINVYDIVISKKLTNTSEVKVGDVITFISTSSFSYGKTVTHRVIEIVNTEDGVGYKTKGDNNLSPDTAPALYKNVIGKVILRIPQLGKLQFFLAKRGGWLIVIVIPALLIIISDVLKIFKLVGVKNKINEINEKDENLKKKRRLKETERKEIIKKKLDLNLNETVLEPIKVKKKTRTVIAYSNKERIAMKKAIMEKENVKSEVKKRKKRK